MYYGCGAKAALSYTSQYEVICRKDGVEKKFLIFKGEDYPESTLLYQTETSEGNGVLIKVNIKRWDFNSTVTAIRKQLCYFPTAHIVIEGSAFDYVNAKIFENELFSWSEIYPSTEMHINFGGVHYPIDWDILGISRINLPIGIKIAPDTGINPFFNRESLEYTGLCKTTIKETISKVSDYFVNKYNEVQPDEKELMEVFEDITNDNVYVTLADKQFQINSILKYASITPKPLKIKGITLENPEYYYYKRLNIFDEYGVLAMYEKGVWKTKHIQGYFSISDVFKKVPIIEVDSTPTGLQKKFLLEKYKGQKVLFIRKDKTRKLGDRHHFTDLYYRYLLGLTTKPKSEWRRLIKEWQFVENQFKLVIINELDLVSSPEYILWLNKHKEFIKQNRKSGNYSSSSNYRKLNKTKDDITIQLALTKEVGNGCKFVKKAVAIKNLNKLNSSTKALHIYFSEDQEPKARQYWELFSNKFNICILSPRELKRLQEIKPKQFMTPNEFLQSRHFCKMMTALNFEKVIKEYDEIYRGKTEIVKNVLLGFDKQYRILKEYKNKHIPSSHISSELETSMREIADLKNLYDHSLDDVYRDFVKSVKKFQFITCLKEPSNSWKIEEVEKYQKLINRLLLMEKKYNNFEDIEIEVKPIIKQEEQLETV